MKADWDLIVVGAGGAGLSAAQYGARANLSTLVVEELASGGQCLLIDNLENYPGFPEALSGVEISQRFEDQAVKFGAEIENHSIQSIRKEGQRFILETDNGTLNSLTVILATGAKHKTLDVPGESEFAGRGVSYCATCDGPFFRDKRMLVVGGGDAACDEATFLSNLTDKILMIHRRDRFRAQASLAQRVLKNPHIEVRFNTELKEIQGDGKVNQVTLIQNAENKTYREAVEAVFVFVGSIPQTGAISGLTLDEGGYVVTNQRMETDIPGLYAVGDVRSTPFRQLVVAAGEGAIAAHMAAQHIDALKDQAYD